MRGMSRGARESGEIKKKFLCSSLSFYSKLSSSFFIYSFSSSFLLFFYLFQFLSNFFKYSLSNPLLSYTYNNFAIYLSGNSPLLNSSTSGFNFISFLFFNLIFHITFSNLPFLNSSIFPLVFFKFSNLSHIFSSIVYPFHFTKYFVLPFLSCLSKISSTSYFFSPATSTGGSRIFFYPSICSLYFTILLSRMKEVDLAFFSIFFSHFYFILFSIYFPLFYF